MRRNGRTDANQSEIVRALRAVGCSVYSLHRVGGGCPDLLVGYRGQTFLLEVKHPQGILTPDQIDWHADWRGQVAVVHSPEEALQVVGALESDGQIG